MRPAAEQPAGAPALLALPAVLRATGYGRSTAYAAMRAQLLPLPVKIGRSSRWPEDEVQAVAAAIRRGDDEDARRSLVRGLRARRHGPAGAALTLLRSYL